MELKAKLKKAFPKQINKILSRILHPIIYFGKDKYHFKVKFYFPFLHRKAIKKLKNKKKIKVVFLALFDSNWKYDRLYQIMEKDETFEPIILICPIVNYGRDNMLKKMKECLNFFADKGYNYVLSYNEKTNTYVDLRKDINPDIIFYTNPYKGLIDDRYNIENFPDILTAYVPYSMQESKERDATYNMEFHNSLWRYYLPTEMHVEYSKRLAINNGKNTFCSGYPGIEGLIDGHKPKDECWKIKSHDFKRIIWAPHHTLESQAGINYSTFLTYCHFMLEMAEKYKDKVQWVFKPHPILINKLYSLWGKEKTDEYYFKWENGENTNYIDGEYTDLFLTSDAMIHDSGSFVAEYLYVNKPVMRPLKEGTKLEDLYCSFGLACLENYYIAKKKEDIENFIKMIIAGEDPLKEKRTNFINKVLIPKDGMPSDLILKDIKDSIKQGRINTK